MNALLSDKVVENLNQSERKEILILIAHRFDMSYSKVSYIVITLIFDNKFK